MPNAPVQRIDQIENDPQARALGIMQEGPVGALRTLGLPLRFDGVRPEYERAAPKLGEHGSATSVMLARGGKPEPKPG